MATTRKFGIISDISGLTAGVVVNSMDFSETVEVAEARDENGAIIDLVGFSNNKTVSISGIMQGEVSALAKAGNSITLDGKTWLITDVSRNETNTGFCTVSISARTADNAIITVINDAGGTTA